MMKKHLLALTLTTLCATTCAMAMEPEDAPKTFAVFLTHQLEEDPASNCYVVT